MTENNGNEEFDVKVYKQSIAKGLKIESFFKECGKTLSVSDFKDVCSCIFIQTMKNIALNRKNKENKGGYGQEY